MSKTNRRRSYSSKRKTRKTNTSKAMSWLDFVKMTHKQNKNKSGWSFSKSLKEAGKRWKIIKGGNESVPTAPQPSV